MLTSGLWSFLAGLSLFLFAVSGLETAVKGLVGRAFKKFLYRQTANPLRAAFGGAVLTAFLQSSSVVLLVTLSFVGAGVLPIRNALALALGANLGTTLDSWLVAWLGFGFDIESFALPLLAFSLLFRLIGNGRTVFIEWARFLFSIAILFLALSFMKSSMMIGDVRDSLVFFSDWNIYWFVPVGFLLTAVIQSSFATMTIGLAALDGGALTLLQAACLVLGAEAGTAVKLLFTWHSDTTEARRMSMGNLVINFITVLIGILLVSRSGDLIPSGSIHRDPLYWLVAFQGAINFCSLLLFMPLLPFFGKWLERVVPEPRGKSVLPGLKDLAPGSLLSYEHLRGGLIQLLNQSEALVRRTVGSDQNDPVRSADSFGLRSFLARRKTYVDDYRMIKQVNGAILEELSDRLVQETNSDEVEKWNSLVTAARNILHVAKTVKDIRVDLKEISASANDDLFGRLDSIRQDTAGFLSLADAPILLDAALQSNREWHDSQVEAAMELLRTHRIKNEEASTLVNIYHELYSSRKAILRARAALG